MHVFVTGGTGQVGRRLIRQLLQRGDNVVMLTRRAFRARELFGDTVTVVEGDPTQSGPWMDAISPCEGVVHLAGENVFERRWNAEYKRILHDSRIRSTQNVVEALRGNPKSSEGQPKVLVNASAIGYYGSHGDEELTEESPPASDFLAQLCVEWERAACAAESAGVRVVRVRVGVVLDKEAGALAKLLTPFKLGVGGPVGSGRQWMSWIHHADLVGIIRFALDHANATGPINGTAPHPETNRAFGKSLGRALHRPSFVWTPALAIRVLVGEAATLVVNGQRVLPRKALQLGYSFLFPTLDGALAEIFA